MFNPFEMSVSGVWGPRPLDLDSAVALLGRFHSALSKVGAPFDNLIASTRPGTRLAEWTGSADQAREILLAGRDYSETTGEPLPEFGYVISFSERRSGMYKAGVMLTLGGTAPRLQNSVGVSLPPGIAHDQPTTDILERLFSIVIDIFEPDWAVVSSNELESLLPNAGLGDASVGWYTYLRSRVEARVVPELPPGVEAQRRGDGLVVILTREWFDPSNPEHRYVLLSVQDRLQRAGLLRTVTRARLARP